MAEAEVSLLGSSSVVEKINSRANSLFAPKPGVPQLQIISLLNPSRIETEVDGFGVRLQNVFGKADLEASKQNEIVRLCVIHQRRSWTTLDISRETLEEVLASFGAFSAIWGVLLAFGIKMQENELEFPRSRTKIRSNYPMDILNTLEYEIAYIFRRVELNNRKEEDCPWSIRQTGFYQKLSLQAAATESQRPRSKYLMIAPSKGFQNFMPKDNSKNPIWSERISRSPWRLHQLLLEESLANWKDYMGWIESQLRELFDKTMLTEVGQPKEDPTWTLSFGLSFDDRQALQEHEDRIIDLGTIFHNMRSTVASLKRFCEAGCGAQCRFALDGCSCTEFLESLHEADADIGYFMECARSLRARAKLIGRVLSDLLNYEDAASLHCLAEESHMESKSIHSLAERGTKDAAAVKALTVISLIYLPTTIVANFFSTEFIHSNENGNLQISGNAWLLAAIAVPLTAVTIAFWVLWVRCTKFPVPILPSYRTGQDNAPPSQPPEKSPTDSFRSKIEKWHVSPKSSFGRTASSAKRSSISEPGLKSAKSGPPLTDQSLGGPFPPRISPFR